MKFGMKGVIIPMIVMLVLALFMLLILMQCIFIMLVQRVL
jgi:hypothetical protein